MKFMIGQEPHGGNYFWRLLDEDENVIARSPALFSTREEAVAEVTKLQKGAAPALANFERGLLGRIRLKG